MPQRADDDTPSPRVGALATLGDVREEAARLYRAARRGDLEPAAASKLASVLSLVARLIEGDSLERRVAEIERRLNLSGASP